MKPFYNVNDFKCGDFFLMKGQLFMKLSQEIFGEDKAAILLKLNPKEPMIDSLNKPMVVGKTYLLTEDESCSYVNLSVN